MEPTLKFSVMGYSNDQCYICDRQCLFYFVGQITGYWW